FHTPTGPRQRPRRTDGPSQAAPEQLPTGLRDECYLPPHTVTRFPPRFPSHSSVEHVRRSRFFHSSELANVSSSVLNSEKMLREATRIIFRFARLRATVSRRGSSRNSHEAIR